MKRLIIIVEGQTEEEFVRSVLVPFFATQGIFSVTPIKIVTSKVTKGGFVNYNHLRNDALRYLNESNTVVSMFVDYFRIPTSTPHYNSCLAFEKDVDKRIDCLENAIAADINHYNFIPYIQKHEFEALLFANNAGFEMYFDAKVFEATNKLVQQFENPEEINSAPETSPSNRILNIIRNYEKVVDGNLIAMEIGLESMLNRCARFSRWINTLVKKMQSSQ